MRPRNSSASVGIVYIKYDERSPRLQPPASTHPISVVHYNQTINRLLQVELHDTVQKQDDEYLKRNWDDEVTIADKYEKCRPEFLKLLGELEDIRESHLRQTAPARHSFEVVQNRVSPDCSAPYKTSAKTRLLAATRIDQLLLQDVL